MKRDLGLHQDAAVRAQKSKDAAEAVSQEMAIIVSSLRANCQTLKVQLAEAERQGKDWRDKSHAEHAALLRASAEFVTQREVLARAASQGQEAWAQQAFEQRQRWERALAKQQQSARMLLRSAAVNLGEFEARDARLRNSLSSCLHELRVCRGHLVSLVHSTSELGHFSTRVGGGYGKVALQLV
jgi:hypothetical protein